MSEPRNFYPNVFDHEQTPLIRKAFALACDEMKTSPTAEPVAEMQWRLADAIVAVARNGVEGAEAVADAALKRCAIGLFSRGRRIASSKPDPGIWFH